MKMMPIPCSWIALRRGCCTHMSYIHRGCSYAAMTLAHRLQSTATTSASASSTSNPVEGDDATTSSSATSTPELYFRPRWGYAAPFRRKSLTDFMAIRGRTEHVVSIAHSFTHPTHNITVTLIPLRHMAHPDFFAQVDELCMQHDSVLMEGRVPISGAPYSTLVPPRERYVAQNSVAGEDVNDHDHHQDGNNNNNNNSGGGSTSGWEPREVLAFYQPFSWGVRDSPNFTVVHAADQYDYESLPWFCSLRHNLPILGSLGREQHCMRMMYPLHANGYRSFAIPWGAAHMPIFHEMLLDNGFELTSLCTLRVLRRADGPISEGEVLRSAKMLQRGQRRRQWAMLLVVVLVVRWLISNFIAIDYNRGPPM